MPYTALLNSFAKSSYGISSTRSYKVFGSITLRQRGDAKAIATHGVS